jgi:hypothetical protein
MFFPNEMISKLLENFFLVLENNEGKQLNKDLFFTDLFVECE